MVLEAPTLTKIKVRGRLLQFGTDSADVGDELDQQPTLGTVEFTCDYPGPRPLVHLASKSFVFPVPVTALIRSDGVVCPPANGVAPIPGEVPPAADDVFVALTAPKGNGFNVEDWTWTARWKPAAGQKWREFTQVIPASDGTQPVDLADLHTTTPTAGVSVPLVYSAGATTDPLPDGFRVGTDLIATPDGVIYATRSI